jgi:hypothetical protein
MAAARLSRMVVYSLLLSAGTLLYCQLNDIRKKNLSPARSALRDFFCLARRAVLCTCDAELPTQSAGRRQCMMIQAHLSLNLSSLVADFNELDCVRL